MNSKLSQFHEKVSISDEQLLNSADISKQQAAQNTQEALEADFSTFMNDFLGNIETLKKTGGNYHRLWCLRHAPINDELMDPNDKETSYLKLSSKKRESLTDPQKVWLEEMAHKIGVDFEDPQYQKIIQSICRKAIDGGKIPLYADLEFIGGVNINKSGIVEKRNIYQKKTIDKTKIISQRPQIQPRNGDTLIWLKQLGACEIRRTNLFAEKRGTTGHTIFSTAKQLAPLFETRTSGISGDSNLGSSGMREIDRDTILLGNRSHSPVFALRADHIFDSAVDTFNKFVEKGYDFIDFNKEGENIVDQNILTVTPDNFGLILPILQKFCGTLNIKETLSEYFDTLPLILLQEALGTALLKIKTENPSNFRMILEEFVRVKNPNKGKLDFHLQWYAFEQFVALGVSPEDMAKYSWDSEIISRTSRIGYRNFILQYYGKPNTNLTADHRFFPKEAHIDWKIHDMYVDANVYRSICNDQQQGSIDVMIKTGNEEGILKRWATFEGEETEENPEQNKQNKDFERILASIKDKSYLLRGNVGEWKSLWLTEFAKYAMLKPYPIKYYKAKDLEFRASNSKTGYSLFGKSLTSQAEEDITQLYTSNKDTLFFFDGIDEIDEIKKDKHRIKDELLRLTGRCFLSARVSEYPESNIGFNTLSLDPISSHKFLASRFPEEELQKLEKLLEKNHLDREIENNPLLLTMVAHLAKIEEIEFKKFAALGIKPLEKIKTRNDLYENATKFMLAFHGKGCGKDELGRRMDELMEYAYTISLWNTLPELDSDKTSDYNERLSILFRKTWTNQHDFIHPSFYEFFLARYYSEKKSQEFPHSISENAKLFYADMQEGKDNVFANLARNYWAGLGSIITWKEKSEKMIKLYMNELLYWARSNILFRLSKQGITSESPVADNILHCILTRQSIDPSQEGFLIWAFNAFESEKRGFLIERDSELCLNIQFFSRYLLGIIQTDSAIRALPEYMFEESSFSWLSGNNDDQQCLILSIARIWTPYALEILKKQFSVSQEYLNNFWMRVFRFSTPLVQGWFLNELDDLQKSQFFLFMVQKCDHFCSPHEKYYEVYKRHVVSYLWDMRKYPSHSKSESIWNNLSNIVICCVENKFITEFSLYSWFFGDNILKKNIRYPWNIVLLARILEKGFPYISRKVRDDLFKQLGIYLRSLKWNKFDNIYIRKLLCVSAQISSQLFRSSIARNKVFHPDFNVNLHELATMCNSERSLQRKVFIRTKQIFMKTIQTDTTGNISFKDSNSEFVELANDVIYWLYDWGYNTSEIREFGKLVRSYYPSED